MYATVDAQWPERTWYPPASVTEEKTTYLELLRALLDKGADPNARLRTKPWYRTFHGDWADPVGATPFWLAAKANDVEAMKILIAGGANPSIPSIKGVSPLQVAAGFGLEPQVTNFAPQARLAAVRYLVEECGADVNAQRRPGVHAAARCGADRQSRCDPYLVAMGADVKARATNVFGGEGEDDKDRRRGRRATRLPTWPTVRARTTCSSPKPSTSSSAWARRIRTTAATRPAWSRRSRRRRRSNARPTSMTIRGLADVIGRTWKCDCFPIRRAPASA